MLCYSQPYTSPFLLAVYVLTNQENNSEVGSRMQQEVQALKQLLRSKLGWEYDIHILGVDEEGEEDGNDDDLPVIVDTSEPYAL